MTAESFILLLCAVVFILLFALLASKKSAKQEIDLLRKAQIKSDAEKRNLEARLVEQEPKTKAALEKAERACKFEKAYEDSKLEIELLNSKLEATKRRQRELGEMFHQAVQETSHRKYLTDSFVYRTINEAEFEDCSIKLVAATDKKIEILPTSSFQFEVKGTDGIVYHTTLNTCTCPDFQFRHQPCKHMYKIALEFGLLGHLGDKTQEQIEKCAAETAAFQETKRKYETTWKRQRAILNQKKQSFPYLADLFAELERYEAEEKAAVLRSKAHPAIKKADEIESNGKKLVKLRRENKSLRYQLNYLKQTVPWLEEFITLPPADAFSESLPVIADAENEYELYREWISPEEWNALEPEQKFQIALDRYKKACTNGSASKTAWAAGVEYERYIGYLYEKQGYSVRYTGATDGLNDLGRDLIVKKDGQTLIIQCKRWNPHKTVHEKHIFQLYGTIEKYRFEHSDEKCSGAFISTTDVSSVAADAARFFNIEVRNIPYSAEYPMIKCNISANGEKIYHLPMDQQYDRIVIEPEKGECYAQTVAEAVELGFRRAKKWKSIQSESSR